MYRVENVFNQIIDFFRGIGSTEFWPARWNCGIWTDFHGWMYIISEVVIWACYFTIPIFLIRLVMKKKDIPLPSVFWLFGAFILLCGTTHLVDAIIFWFPIYRVSAFLRAITAVVSFATVIAVIRILPEAFKLKTSHEFEKEIARRVEVEKSLILEKERAKKSEQVKEQFLANMSHEIRTPMNSIIGFTQLLDETELNDEQKQWLGAIKSSGENLLVIINDILDFSKIEAGKMDLREECCNIYEMVYGVVHQFKPACTSKNIRLKLTMDDNLATHYVCDKVRLSQVLTNLISNAVKFTEKGGVHIQVKLKEYEMPNQSVIKFAVRDTGIGIAKSDLTEIFESFTQIHHNNQNKGGTGLGLAISKKLVEKMGGEMHADSVLNVGSDFGFEIVVREAVPFEPIEQDDNATDGNSSNIKDVKVLLAEDNKLNRQLVKAIFKRWGTSVTTVNNGLEAVQELQNEKYDLVLMDIQMPEMNGYDASKIIRKKMHDDIPIIAMTAHAFESKIAKTQAAGMDDYISKPFKPEELLTKILKYTKGGMLNHQKVS